MKWYFVQKIISIQYVKDSPKKANNEKDVLQKKVQDIRDILGNKDQCHEKGVVELFDEHIDAL